MKRHLTLWLLVTTLSLVTFGFSKAFGDSGFSLTSDGIYSRHLSSGTVINLPNNALGGSALLEWQPIDLFSVGVDFSIMDYFGLSTGAREVNSLDGIIRFIPWPSQIVSPYIIGGAGLNPFAVNQTTWPNTYHVTAGAGFRYFVLPQWALDANATYDFYDPSNAPLQAINIRAGISYYFKTPFENPSKIVFSSAETVIYQPVTVTDTDEAPESLQDIAKSEYGDPNLYPLIVDANFKDKSKPLVLAPGTQLIIPQNPTEDMISHAHLKAVTPEYVQAAQTFSVPHIENLEYRLEPSDSDDAVSDSQKDDLVFQSDSLWDIAARPDVYDDPELYPILVDANFERFSDPLILKPGTKITIPHDLTKAQIRRARLKAWTPEYERWRGSKVTEEEYRQWRQDKGLPAIDEDTGDATVTGDEGDTTISGGPGE
jgi:hypothetical protein